MSNKYLFLLEIFMKIYQNLISLCSNISAL